MTHTLTRGRNLALTSGETGPARIEVGVTWELSATDGAVEGDVFALLLGPDGTVVSDRHLVFYNNDASPDDVVRLLAGPPGGSAGEDRQRVEADLAGMPAEVDRVLVGVGVEDDRAEATLVALRGLAARVREVEPDEDGAGRELAHYVVDRELALETAMVLVEVYRSGEEWKVVAVGAGYASGLRGVATEYGVHV